MKIAACAPIHSLCHIERPNTVGYSLPGPAGPVSAVAEQLQHLPVIPLNPVGLAPIEPSDAGPSTGPEMTLLAGNKLPCISELETTALMSLRPRICLSLLVCLFGLSGCIATSTDIEPPQAALVTVPVKAGQ